MQTDEEIGKVAAAVPVIICILSGPPGVRDVGAGGGWALPPGFSLTLLSAGPGAVPGVAVEEGLPGDPVPQRQDHDHIPPVSGVETPGPWASAPEAAGGRLLGGQQGRGAGGFGLGKGWVLPRRGEVGWRR